MIFSTIQAADAILWYIKMEKNQINYIISSFFIPFILCLQVYYNILIKNKYNDPFTFILLFILTIYIFQKFKGYSTPLCKNKLSSPIWGNDEIKLWEIILFASLILYPHWEYILAVIIILVPILKIYFGGAYGSLWCAIGNWIAFKYLLYF